MDIRKRNIAAFIASLVLIGQYFYLWNHYAINIPKWDDHPLKLFVLDFEKADGLGAKILELFKQHNEHRIAFTRLVTWIDYTLFDEINFRHLMFFGNLGLLLIAWLLTRFFRQTIAPFWYALPVITYWFSLAFWENAFWGMAAVQNIWVVAWALLCFWVLRRNDRNWGWALPISFIAFFTSGNGILTLPVGLVILVLQKRWKLSVIWTVFSLLLVAYYFLVLDYQKPPHSFVLSNIKGIVRGMMLMAGSLTEGLPFSFNRFETTLLNGWLTVFVSVCLLLYIVRNFFEKHFELTHYDYFYVGGTLFALLSIGLVAYSRAGSGTEVMLNSRYKLYSAMLISLNIAYLTSMVNQKFRDALTATFLVGSLFLFVSNQHYHLYDTIANRKFLVSSAFNWVSFPNPNNPTKFLYKRPALFSDTLNKQHLPTLLDSTTKSQTLWHDEKYVNNDLRDGGDYLYVKNDSATYLLPYHQRRKHSLRNLLNYNKFFENGIDIDIAEYIEKSGSYEVYEVDYNKHTLEVRKGKRVYVVAKQQNNVKVNW